ncbi:2Fe-2S ferredoxin-type domain-containing protein [Phaeosphaeriaceae sp. PMI808]|nr:2Fe-2S ferredoxin-type domain-containing protein [Phaeosphaeriaceae sp. PMI808]
MASRRACLHASRCSEVAASFKSRAPSFTSPKFSTWQSPRPTNHMSQSKSLWPQQAPQALAAFIPSLLSSRRQLSITQTLRHGHLDTPKPGEERTVTFIDKESHSHTFTVSDGDNLLDIAQANDLEMEGACGGSCACSTCHVIVDNDAYYEKMDEPDDDENDMLDLAFGLTETSRLGCQVKMRKDLDGLVVRLPRLTRNLQASDFK